MDAETQEVITKVLEELTLRSGININRDLTTFIKLAGPDAEHAPGSYMKAKMVRGKYRPELLNLVFENQPGHELQVLFHEIAHATGPRLGRVLCARDQRLYDIEEVTAETAAGMLIRWFGLMTTKIASDSDEYLYYYSLHLSDLERLSAKTQARLAVLYILDNWLIDFNKHMLSKKEAA